MSLPHTTGSKIFIILVTVFSSIALLSPRSLAGPFMSYPGVRARAMGGAFTGIADDSSAIWYNPAGLAREKEEDGADEEGAIDISIEWSQAASIDEKDGPLRADESTLFAGGTYTCKEFGLGMSYYTPYTIKYWAHDQGKYDTAWGKVNEIIQTVGIPLAVSFIDGRVKLGMAMEMVHVAIHNSRVFYRDSWGWADEYPAAEESTDGLAGSGGTLITIIDDKARSFDLKLGGTYRLKSLTDIGSAALKAEKDEAVAQLFFDRPESFDVGLSLSKAFSSIGSSLVVGAQYGRTDWGSASKEEREIAYQKISVGLEYAIDNKDAVLKKKAFRVGYYTSKPTEFGTVWNWPDVQGITYGLGISVGYDSVRIGLDVTQEHRSLRNDTGYDDKAMVTSVALTCSF
jgi:hypothetical protein